MDGGEEIACGYVVTSSYSSELFELCEKVFDQVTRFVESLVIVTLDQTVFLRRDNDRFTRRLQRQDDPHIGIIAPVC